MKTLVVFYSRTGNTRRVALRIAEHLGAQVDEITDAGGTPGFLALGRDAFLGRDAAIRFGVEDFSPYGAVIVGTPVWAFTVSGPVRTYLRGIRGKVARVAFFCTMGGAGSSRTFRNMERTVGMPPVALLTVTEKEIREESFRPGVEMFVETVRQACKRT